MAAIPQLWSTVVSLPSPKHPQSLTLPVFLKLASLHPPLSLSLPILPICPLHIFSPCSSPVREIILVAQVSLVQIPGRGPSRWVFRMPQSRDSDLIPQRGLQRAGIHPSFIKLVHRGVSSWMGIPFPSPFYPDGLPHTAQLPCLPRSPCSGQGESRCFLPSPLAA